MDMAPEQYDQWLHQLRILNRHLWGEDSRRALRRLIDEVESEKEATVMSLVENQMYGNAH
jgi:hypothetical protein